MAWRERGERLLAAVVGLLGAGGGALEKRLAGTNEPIRLGLVDGLAPSLDQKCLGAVRSLRAFLATSLLLIFLPVVKRKDSVGPSETVGVLSGGD